MNATTILSAATIADRLARGRTRALMNRLADRMARDGVDVPAFLAEVDIRRFPLKWHLTWLFSHYVERVRRLPAGDQEAVWRHLTDCDHPGIRRDLWRALSFLETIDEDIAGDVFDHAIEIVRSSKEPIAMRAHAMFAARNIALPYEELRSELGLVLETLRRDESAAVRARSKNMLKELRSPKARKVLNTV